MKNKKFRHVYLLLAYAYNFFVRRGTETFKGKKCCDGFRANTPRDYITVLLHGKIMLFSLHHCYYIFLYATDRFDIKFLYQDLSYVG